jgi:hypothetical protein
MIMRVTQSYLLVNHVFDGPQVRGLISETVVTFHLSNTFRDDNPLGSNAGDLSKNELKKRAKAAEKEKKAAEKAAKLAEQERERAEAEEVRLLFLLVIFSNFFNGPAISEKQCSTLRPNSMVDCP